MGWYFVFPIMQEIVDSPIIKPHLIHSIFCFELPSLDSSNLEPIPKFDRIIASCPLLLNCDLYPEEKRKHDKKNNHYTIITIPDKLWNEIKAILPIEKPSKTVGRPIVPYRKVLDGILYILRTGCQWKMLPSEFGSGSTCHRRFQEWNKLDVFKKTWVKLLKSYDDVVVSTGHGNP